VYVIKFLGDLYLLLKKLAEAAAQYQSAISVRECYVQAYNGLALAHALKAKGENTEQLREAFKAASRAIEINPRYEGSYFLYALLCRDVLKATPGELSRLEPAGVQLIEEAVTKLRIGRERLPGSSPILMAHGTACVVWAFGLSGLRQKQTAALAEADRSIAAMIERDGKRYEPWLIRAVARTLEGTYEKAALDFAEASRRAPDNAHVYRWMGYRSALARDVAAARSEWKKALELDPSLRGELEPELAGLEKRK